VIAADADRSENIFFVTRNYDSDGNLAIVRSVGGVDSAAALIEANFSAKVAAERGFKRGVVELHVVSERWGSGFRHNAQNIFEDAGARRKGIAEVRSQR
jgi:hypothetical protein